MKCPLLAPTLAFLCLCAAPLAAELPDPTQRAIDDIVHAALDASGTPSASVAIVQDGAVAFTRAYGQAQVDPAVPATAAMRYKIASNSKQFIAASILLLAESGKLSLDDKVARYFPDLTRAGEITIRQLLSHTSGYRDYYPLDYVAPFMARDTTPADMLARWAKIPLDFEPGTRWQYSNTNYVIAGLIIEKVARQSLTAFLRTRILEPLKLRSAVDVTAVKWSASDPVGYTHFATGPVRVAPAEGDGWMWAAGQLAMTAGDLALWDISLINGTLLKPASLKALSTEVQVSGGTGSRYALGLSVSTLASGRRRWAHGGGASGFVSQNVTYPDDRMAITVLTNCDAGPAAKILQKIEELLLAPAADPGAAASLAAAKRLFAALAEGRVDHDLISPDLAAYFTPQAIADFAASLKPLGAATGFTQTSQSLRGGMTYRSFAVQTATKKLRISTFAEPDGRFSQFLIAADF